MYEQSKSGALREQLARLHESAKTIEAAAEGRELTGGEAAELDGVMSRFKDVERRLEVALADERLGAPQARKIDPGGDLPRPARSITGGTLASARSSTWNFPTFTSYLAAVRGAASGKIDQRLLNAITTYGNEGSTAGGTEGGFAVAPDHAKQIFEAVQAEDSILTWLRPIQCSSNILSVPTDEAAPHTASGVQAYWTGEAQSITPTVPALKMVNVNLFKAAALTHLSDEVDTDAPALGEYVMRRMAVKVSSLVNASLVVGDGLAKPAGLLSAASAVTVSKEGSQTAATVVVANLAKMTARLLPGGMRSAFWLVHSSVLPQIYALSISNQPVFTADFRQSAAGTLLGRPIVISEHCAVLGTVNDVALIDPNGYICAVKAAGMQVGMSAHFSWDQHLNSYKCTFRVGGTPALSAAVARKNGSDTQSHIVKLETRS